MTVLFAIWSAMVDYTKPIQKTAVLILSITDAGRKRSEETSRSYQNIQRLMQVFNSGEQAELTGTLEEIQTYRSKPTLKTILT